MIGRYSFEALTNCSNLNRIECSVLGTLFNWSISWLIQAWMLVQSLRPSLDCHFSSSLSHEYSLICAVQVFFIHLYALLAIRNSQKEYVYSKQNFPFILHICAFHNIKCKFTNYIPPLLWLLGPKVSCSTNFSLHLAITLDSTDFNTTQTWVAML